MKHIVFTLSLLLALPANLLAAEVTNLKVGQSGDKGFATYDLAGKVGEREAEVVVTLTINGEKYSADKLTLSGDFGKKVKTGVGRRIVWDILSDIPTGFDGEVVWNVDATSLPQTPAAQNDVISAASTPGSLEKTHPFEFSEKTVRDKNTGLVWLRNISRGGKPTGMMNARSYALSLKKEKLGDCTEWRLPGAGEMSRIVSYAQKAGYTAQKGNKYPADYFKAIGFTSVENDYYWVGIGTPLRSATVDLEDGLSTVKTVEDHLQYWPVCKPD